MRNKILVFLFVLVFALPSYAEKTIAIVVEPKEASIYVNNDFVGYGYAEIPKPSGKHVAVLRIECEEYKPLLTKIYGTDKRKSISYTLQQDGFYRSSATSGIVNKYFTVDIDPQYFTINDGKIDVSRAWKLLHQILLNYFNEISTTDFDGGYVQTPWAYKTFTMSEMQMRTRVTIRDISTPSHVAFQIKIDSETAASMAAKHGEFSPVDRIPKDFDGIIQELQTRIGKVSSL
ncbi:MAG: PEGA domain-containing protein [Prevotellaceae bacterium]|nr:PEGA domain-containing protein [Candidatus Colivivens equi]